MTDAVEQQPDQTAPAEAPAPAPANDLDSLLAQFDREATPSEPDSNTADIDSLLGFNQNDARVEELQGQVTGLESQLGQLQSQISAEREEKEFSGFCEKLQAECGPNVPDTFARMSLMAAAAERPELFHAWMYRKADRAAVDRELTAIETMLQRLQRDPNASPERIAELQQAGYLHGLALNAGEILNREWRNVVKAAKAFRPIDEEVTHDRNMVAMAVKSEGQRAPDPPPNFGRMTDAEFRKWKLTNLGWE